MFSTEIARALKDRDNPESVGVIIGTVVSVNPLQISIYNGCAILSKDNGNLYIGSLLQNAINASFVQNGFPEHGTVSTNGTSKLNILSVGDSVACIPTGDAQKFVVYDKVV